MRVLTIYSAFFMPLTFIVGVWGLVRELLFGLRAERAPGEPAPVDDAPSGQAAAATSAP